MDRGLDLSTHQFHAQGGNLADQHIAITVDNQTRQTVGLAEHQAIAVPGIKPLAQRQRTAQALDQQCMAHGNVSVAAEDAGTDQRLRIDATVADKGFTMIDDAHRSTGRKGGQRRRSRIDFVGEHPEVPGSQALVLVAFEAQHGESGGNRVMHRGFQTVYV